MEAGVRRGRDLLLLAAFTLLLHAPFLKQPVQGDEVTYLDIARHVLEQPLTPLNFQYVFMGHAVDAAGHPHPPLDAYLLALAWTVRGHFSVLFFHLFYLLFALGISFAAYALAARFTDRALWAALLVAASPLVQVNTNTLGSPESPALAFMLIGAAAFLWRRFWISGIALALAGLTELQALALPPILLLEYLVKRERPSRGALLALAAPYAGLAGWQALEFALTHRLPGAAAFSYSQSSAFTGVRLKASSALALLEHLGILVVILPVAWRRLWGLVPGVAMAVLVHDYPWWERALLAIFIALGVNALLWIWESRRWYPLLTAWCLLYFAFAATVFFAGASRYLLPLVAPMVLLFALQFAARPRWLGVAMAVSLILGLNLSLAAYEFARIYPEVQPPPGGTFLENGDWGFRYYMAKRGGRPLAVNTSPVPGEWIVSSELSLGGYYDSLAEEAAVPMRSVDMPVRTPLRLIDLHAHSGFSAASSGLLPFSFSTRPLDRITYSRTSSFLNVPAKWTPTQFSGHLVYLPDMGEAIRLPVDSPGALRFALFGRGQGQVTFRIARPSGEMLFERTATVHGELWAPAALPVGGLTEVVLSIDAPPDVKAGWGELVYDDRLGPSETSLPSAAAALSYLKLGDLRARPQLDDGWYTIEDGGWRWMSKRAEATLGAPQGRDAAFEVELFFPPDHMRRAGGPVTLSVSVDGKKIGEDTYVEPGGRRFHAKAPSQFAGRTVQVTLQFDRAVPPEGDEKRVLGAVVSGLGFVNGQ